MLVYLSLLLLAALAHSQSIRNPVTVEVGTDDKTVPYRRELHGTFQIAAGQCTGEVMREMLPDCNAGGLVGTGAVYSRATAWLPLEEKIKVMFYLNDSPRGPLYIYRDPDAGCDAAIDIDVMTVCNPIVPPRPFKG